MNVFANHIEDKIIVDNPIIFNIEIFLFILVIIFFGRKKRVNREIKLLDKDITTEIRGLVIIFIILHHLFRIAIDNIGYNVILYYFGMYGVGVFLLLSGYGLTISAVNKGTKNFFEKKILTIFLPFIFMNILWVILNKFLLNINNGLLRNITDIIGITIMDRNYWYVKYIMICYFIFYVNNLINKEKSQKIINWILVSFLIAFNQEFGAARYNAFSFTIGIIIALYYERVKEVFFKFEKEKCKVKVSGVLITVLIVYSLFKLGQMGESLNNNKILTIIFIFFISILISIFGKKTLYLTLKNEKGIMVFVVLLITYFWNTDVFTYISYSLSSGLGAIMIISLYSFLNNYYTSPILSKIGSISFELFLIHGAFMYSYDFILFRGPIEITIFTYLIFIILLAFVLNRVFFTLVNINKK